MQKPSRAIHLTEQLRSKSIDNECYWIKNYINTNNNKQTNKQMPAYSDIHKMSYFLSKR